MKNLKPLTDSDRDVVRQFFATGDTSGFGKGRIWFMYGRMRAHGEFIPEGEAILERKAQLRKDSYRQSKEQEIARGLHDYQNDHQETSEYEVMRITDWEGGRSLVIGIVGYDGKKLTHSHTVEIFESLNPEYFSECIMKYAPGQALSSDKPF